MRKIILGISIAILALIACRENYDLSTVREEGTIPIVNVESGLAGRVLDTSGEPVGGALVEAGGKRTWTDDQGYFLFPKGLYDGNGTLLRIEKSGYFTAHRFAYPQLGAVDNVVVRLLPASFVSEFEASEIGLVELPNASVVIPPGSIGKNGAPYDDGVEVQAVWLDPTKDETFQTMPGDLRGLEDGEVKILQTFGMLGVELRGRDGSLLQLLPGKTATISMVVPDALLSKAPPTIPLWHFDEADGYWKKEGEATLKNGRYEGTVGHFSFWNCDMTVPLAFLEGKVIGASKNPLLGTVIYATTPNYGYSWGYINDNGGFKGLVPIGEPLTLEVRSWCGDLLSKTTYPALTQDTKIPDIQLGQNGDLTITGTLQTCDGKPLANGLCAITLGDTLPSTYKFALMAGKDGKFEVTFPKCFFGNLFHVQAFDPISLKQSSLVSVPVLSATQDVGILSPCAVADEYMIVTVNGKADQYLTNLNTYYDNGLFGVSTYTLSLDNVYIYFDKYNAIQQTATVTDIMLGNNYRCNPCALSDLDTVLVSSAPLQVGSYCQGKVTGRILPLSGGSQKVPFKMEFRVRRK